MNSKKLFRFATSLIKPRVFICGVVRQRRLFKAPQLGRELLTPGLLY